MTLLCSEEELVELMQNVEEIGNNNVSNVESVLEKYPQDPRLHFLRGSVLASAGHLVEAHDSMKTAVDLAPDFLIARFQLGFFELSSGEPQAALENWKPLESLPEQNYLRRFVAGLTFLIQDEFELAVNNLRSGIAINKENLPLNHDMQLIIEKCNEILSEDGRKTDDESVSSTSLLLNQFTRSEEPS